jgi:glycosyltransferase involved in cell wall biosynthesis
MKILFAVRLYSGLRDSIATGTWAPTGAPTVYKLLETLCASKHEVELIFTCKEDTGDFDSRTDRDVYIQGLEQHADILAGEAYFPAWAGRLRWYLSEMRQTRKLLRLAKNSKPDLIYVDRGNLWAASVLAKLCRVPVIYRVMGVSPSIKSAFDGNRPRQIMTRRQLRSPFSLVICSLDGSGGEIWLDRILDAEVRRVVALNGVDLPSKEVKVSATARHTRGPTTVLFLGRLDPIKGCDRFLAAFHAAYREVPGELRAVIIGEGPSEQALRRSVKDWGIQDSVRFTGALRHDEVLVQYNEADIYVSLNRMGNLSNANLEAMRSGCCMIIPSARPSDGVDLATDKIFPDSVMSRVVDADDVEGLCRTMLHLHRNPEEREARAHATQRLATEFIPAWKQRIDAEVRVLEAFAEGTVATKKEAAIAGLEWSPAAKSSL